MRPFGWLPEWPKWKLSPSGVEHSNLGDCRGVLSGNVVSQQVSPDWVASIEISGPLGDAKQCPALENDSASDSVNTWEEALDLKTFWPNSGHHDIEVNMDPSLSPDFLESEYKAFLLGKQPLALFPKQVLAKARMGMDCATLIQRLHNLLQTPTEIDEKFSLSNDANSGFLAELRGLVDDMHPISDLVKVLRLRDTQLQILLGLEQMALIRTKGNAKRAASEVENSASVSDILDIHFDRLCIWQAVDNTDVVQEFCGSAIIPFYKARAPKKVKQLVRVSRGTLKLRSRPVKQTDKHLPPFQREDTPLRTPGLLKALQMQDYAVSPASSQTQDRQTNSSRRLDKSKSSKAAARSVSHPVYRQQPRHGQVEVRFKKVSKRDSGSTRTSPSPSLSRTNTQSDLKPASHVERPKGHPHDASQSETKSSAAQTVEYIEATPTKARSTYLEALPQPTVLFENDDDVIGSTDSDE